MEDCIILTTPDLIAFYAEHGFDLTEAELPTPPGVYSTMGWSVPDSASDILRPCLPDPVSGTPLLPNCELVATITTSEGSSTERSKL